MVKKTLFLLLILLLPAYLFAAELSSTITPQSGTTADEFIFTVTIEGTSDTTQPVLSTGSDFEVSYTGPQASVTIVNGSMNAVVQHLYRLYPKKTGALLTPSAEVTIDGRTLTAVPLTVQVQKSTALNASTGASYFLEQLVDSNTVYAGQQVVNSLRLYSKEPILEANFSDLSFDSVWVEEMGKQESFRKNVGGAVYTVYELKRALYPLVPTDFTLPQREIQIKVADRSGKSSNPLSRFGLFSDNIFGFQQVAIKRLRSDPLDVHVLPLPPVPQRMKSAQADSIPVGDTHFSTGLNTQGINIGESKTVSFVVESTGNLHPLEKIPFPELPEVKVYPEHPSTSYSVKNGKLVTKKTFKYSLVPLRGGTFHLPSMKLLYFDPMVKQYNIASTRETSFFVNGEAQQGSTETIKTPDQQKQGLPEATPPSQVEMQPYQATSTSFWQEISVQTFIICLIALILFAVIGYFLFHRHRKNKRLSLILSELGDAETSDQTRERLCEYLSRRFEVTPGLHTGDLKSRIGDITQDQGLQFKLLSLIDELEVMSYSNRDDIRPLAEIKNELLSSIKSF